MTDYQIEVVDVTGMRRSAEMRPNQTVISVQVADDRVVTFSADLLARRADGYYVPLSFEQYATTHERQQLMVIPLIEEQLRVRKRTVEAEKLRLVKRVREEEETVSVPLTTERLHVERIPINRVVEQVHAMREETDRLIIPIHEERLVVRKEIVLIEELHVISEKVVTESTETFTLRREELNVENIDVS